MIAAKKPKTPLNKPLPVIFNAIIIIPTEIISEYARPEYTHISGFNPTIRINNKFR